MLNKIFLIGNLGKDPEIKTLADGQKVCSFSIATSEKWTDKQGQKKEKTEWHRISTWGRLAEICAEYLKKGRQVFIEGKIQYRSWETDQGEKKYATDIVANTVQFLGGNPIKETQGEESKTEALEDLPF